MWSILSGIAFIGTSIWAMFQAVFAIAGGNTNTAETIMMTILLLMAYEMVKGFSRELVREWKRINKKIEEEEEN